VPEGRDDAACVQVARLKDRAKKGLMSDHPGVSALLAPERLGSMGRIFAEAAESMDVVDPRLSQSLARGLAILECYDADNRLLGIAELAERLNASRSTTHRYVTTLVVLGYLERGRERKYQLTRGVTRLGHTAMSSTSLAAQASDDMGHLAHETGFAVNLGVLDGCDLVLVDRIAGRRYRRASRRSKTQLPGPAHRTALGLMLLAMLPDYAQREIMDELALNQGAQNKITSKKALRTALADIADEELATSRDDDAAGSAEVAVPLRGADGEVRAALGLSVQGATITPDELANAMRSHLISAADRISARLGYRASANKRGLGGG
jgi:IclR family pca regulon transcriptional regulator